MYLVAIAWMYVVLMMSVAEATSTQGTVLGALVTFGLYGLLPLSIVMYLLGTPMRRRARLAREAEAARAVMEGEPPCVATSAPPDGGSQASGDAVPPVREKP